MIVKNLLAVLGFISVSWFCIVSGAPSPSYSKVYVRRNAEATPVEYVNYEYGAPALPLSASLTSASVVPCVSPCVVPGQSVAALAPLNANLIYNSPISNVPVILPPNNDDKLSYEYSYVVYDDDSGDQKQQRELSDGSVVHGQYSLIQPDGHVREVKYTADDVKGFNAVVRNFLPSHAGEKKAKSNEITPCHEVQNETSTEEFGESHESSESGEKRHSKKESHEKVSHVKSSHEKGSHEKGSHEKGSPENSQENKDNGEQKPDEEKSEESVEESRIKEDKGYEKLHHGEHSESKSSEKDELKPEKSSSSEAGKPPSEEDSSSSEGESNENKSKEAHENVIEHHSKEHIAELKSSQASDEKSSDSEEDSTEEKEKSEEARNTELISHVQHQPEHQQHHVTHETSAPPYSDLIRCIQSFMEKTKGAGHALGSNSPLAYVLLPSGPC